MDSQAIINQTYEVRISDYISEAWNIFKDNAGIFILATIIVGIINALVSNIPIIGLIISAPITAGFSWMALRASMGEKPDLSDLKKGFEFIVPLVLFTIVAAIMVFIGFVALIIPGIYLAVGYSFAQLLIINNKMNFWDAMETSRKVVTNNWFSLFGLVIVQFFIALLGVLALFVGLLVAIPLVSIVSAVAFRDIFLNQLNLNPEL